MMTVTFRQLFRDRFAFAVYHLLRNPFAILISVGLFLLITFTILVPGYQQASTDKPTIVRVIAFLMVEMLLGCFLVAFWVVVMLLTMISRRNKTLFCQKTITLGAEVFVGESPYGRSEMRWTIVQKLGRTRRHIFIYLAQENAYVIPRRAFESTAQWDAFYNYCVERTKQANEQR